MTELTSSEYRRRDRDIEATFRDLAKDTLADQPRRTAVAAAIARFVLVAVNRLPGDLAYRVHGDDYWQSRVATALGASVCRVLGHRWDICVPGRPPRIGHLLACSSCTAMPNTDDPDWFHPGTRDRRDFAAVGFELDHDWTTARCCHPASRYQAAPVDDARTPTG